MLFAVGGDQMSDSNILDSRIEGCARRYRSALEEAIQALQHEISLMDQGLMMQNLQTSDMSMLQGLIRKGGELNALLNTKFYVESREAL
jgi:hypothetical protein